jgi:hypothetical protein
MNQRMQIEVDREVYERLMELMVPPTSDANAVIRELLFQDGRHSRAAIGLMAGRPKSYEDELQRARDGVYDTVST